MWQGHSKQIKQYRILFSNKNNIHFRQSTCTGLIQTNVETHKQTDKETNKQTSK